MISKTEGIQSETIHFAARNGISQKALRKIAQKRT
jgi:hypothetical protein